MKIKLAYKKYSALHHWLRYHFGSAYKCQNPNCPNLSKKYQWALKKGCNYEYKIENFFMLCASCHQKYDLTEETREKMRQAKKGYRMPRKTINASAKARIGVPRTFQTRERISKALTGKKYPEKGKKVYCFTLKGVFVTSYPTLEEAARQTGFDDSNISSAALGRQKTSNGFLWSYSPSILLALEKEEGV